MHNKYYLLDIRHIGVARSCTFKEKKGRSPFSSMHVRTKTYIPGIGENAYTIVNIKKI